MKQTHKRRAAGDVQQVIAGAPSAIVAAERLGVARSTVYRWEAAGSSPGGQGQAIPPGVQQSPEGWAGTMRREYVLDASQGQLVTLGAMALAVAQDATEPTPVRLLAAGRFQQIAKQLSRCAVAVPAPAPKPVVASRPVVRRRDAARDARDYLETLQ